MFTSATDKSGDCCKVMDLQMNSKYTHSCLLDKADVSGVICVQFEPVLTLSVSLSVVGVGNGTKMLSTMLAGSKVSFFAHM